MSDYPPQGSGSSLNSLSKRGAVDLSPNAIFSQDTGKNWTDLGAIENQSVISICYIGNGIVLSGDNNGNLWRSADYGNTWINLGLPFLGSDIANTISYLGNGTVIVGDGNGIIWRSTDFGLTWTNIATLTLISSLQTSCYLGNGISIIGDSGGHIYRNTNFGLAPWTDLGAISLPPGFDFNTFSYLGNGIAIAPDGLGNIWKSIDFGLTWTDLGTFSVALGGFSSSEYLTNGITIVNDHAGHIFRSIDFGLTWLDLGIITASIPNIITYLGNGISIIGVNDGHVWRSTNFGLTWTDLGLKTVVGAKIFCSTYLQNGVVLIGDSSFHILRSDTSYKKSESQSNYTKRWINKTAIRALNSTYNNLDSTRTLQIKAGVRCQITGAAGIAYAKGKSDTASPPVTAASPIVGIQLGLNGEDNNFEIVFDAEPNKNYRIDSTTNGNGTVTLDSWFEMYL